MTGKLPPTASVATSLEGAKLHAPAAQRNTNVLSALDDIKRGEYNRRRFAALLAFDDEVQRNVPGGEDPTQKMLEKRG